MSTADGSTAIFQQWYVIDSGTLWMSRHLRVTSIINQARRPSPAFILWFTHASLRGFCSVPVSSTSLISHFISLPRNQHNGARLTLALGNPFLLMPYTLASLHRVRLSAAVSPISSYRASASGFPTSSWNVYNYCVQTKRAVSKLLDPSSSSGPVLAWRSASQASTFPNYSTEPQVRLFRLPLC